MREAVIAIIILLSVNACFASDIYRYTDANGVVVLTTDPIDPNIKYKLVAKDENRIVSRFFESYPSLSELVQNPDSRRRILQWMYEPSVSVPSTYTGRERSRKYHGKRN